jgi:hypothetical protein
VDQTVFYVGSMALMGVGFWIAFAGAILIRTRPRLYQFGVKVMLAAFLLYIASNFAARLAGYPWGLTYMWAIMVTFFAGGSGLALIAWVRNGRPRPSSEESA